MQQKLMGNRQQGISQKSISAVRSAQMKPEFSLRQYYSNLLILQNQLNQELLVNAYLMNNYMNIQALDKYKNNSSQGSTHPSLIKNVGLKEDEKMPYKQKSPLIQNTRKGAQRYQKRQEDSEYQPQSELSNQNIRYRLSQTKNVPKNYGKAIIGFIKKFKSKTRDVLHHLGIDDQDFLEYTQSVRQKLNTIADLRQVWMQQTNYYAKAFRILSMEYLRRYSFSHIFNSRVENHGKHIKYRYKILDGLRNPKQFTQIKDF